MYEESIAMGVIVLTKYFAALQRRDLTAMAEYGLGTDDDGLRARYIERGLEVTHQAMARGVDVRGFFHWAAVDNYEWLHGYDVSFGIIDRDRKVRDSAKALRREALGF